MMGSKIVRAVGGHALHRFMDVELGWRLMRDRTVSGWTKLLALGIGIAIVALLIAFEVPLEFLLAALMPAFGAIIDFCVDGLEIFLLPGLIACAILPRIAKVSPSQPSSCA